MYMLKLFPSRPVVQLNPLRRNGVVVWAEGVAAYYNYTSLVSGHSLNFPDGVHAVNVAIELEKGVFFIVGKVPGTGVGLLVPMPTAEGSVGKTLYPLAGGGDLLRAAGAAVGVAFHYPVTLAERLSFEAVHGGFDGLTKATYGGCLVIELSFRRNFVDVERDVAGRILVFAGNEVFRGGKLIGLNSTVAGLGVGAGGSAQVEREEDK
jgi:hypothetical protein